MKVRTRAVNLLDQGFHISCVWSLAVEYLWGIQGQAHHLCSKRACHCQWRPKDGLIVQMKNKNGAMASCVHEYVNQSPSDLWVCSELRWSCSIIGETGVMLGRVKISKLSTWHTMASRVPVWDMSSTSQRCAYSRFVSPAPNFASGSVSRGRKRFHSPAALASACNCWCLAGIVQVSCS